MTPWINGTESLEEIPEGAKAFVYKIELGDKFYIGKKNFYRQVTRPPLAGKKRKRKSVAESNWKKYCSSSDKVRDLVNDGVMPNRIILKICKDLKEATYFENKFLYENLHKEDCLNDNISGKIFKEEVIRWET